MIYTIFSLLGVVTLALAVVALVAYAIKGDRPALLYSMAAIVVVLITPFVLYVWSQR